MQTIRNNAIFDPDLYNVIEIDPDEYTRNKQNLAYRNRKIREKKLELICYYIKQKLLGMALIAIGCITSFLLDGDGSYLIFTIIIGIYAIFTKKRLM